MLAFLGLEALDELFAAVPAALQVHGGLAMADGLPEPDVLDAPGSPGRRQRARTDRLVCFAGAGAYDHEVPPVVRALAGRSEFVTSYTPYQPEVAQGVLQAVFEFQTMVARLAGLPVANASLYDGASALVEAVNLGVAATGRQTVWLSSGIHPHWRDVLGTFAAGTGHRLVDMPDCDGGRTVWPGDPGGRGARRGGGRLPQLPGLPRGSGRGPAGVRRPRGAAGGGGRPGGGRHPALARASGVPTWWWGRGRHLGTPLGFGGPYLGLFACSLAQVRRLPGRLVGETVDTEGRRAYVTTLRAREQDIRREKATSNVCTNQTLMAVTAAVQLGWLGTSGLAEVALRCARGTRYLREALPGSTGCIRSPATRRSSASSPSARRCPARLVVERLAEEGFLAGVALADLVGDEGDGSVGRRRRRSTDYWWPSPSGEPGPRSTPTWPPSTRRCGRDGRRRHGERQQGQRAVGGCHPPSGGRWPRRQRTAAGARGRTDHLRAVATRPAELAAADDGHPRVGGRGAGPGRPIAVPRRCRWPRCPSATWWGISPG